MVSYSLYENVTENLSSYTRTQVLTLAAFGLERLWKMFNDWTKTEGDALLYQRPISFRQRTRDILDFLWEQIESGQEINSHCKEHDSLLDFINAACDENDAPDVDTGTGRPLIDMMFSGVHCFFNEIDAESYASSCITAYASYLADILYNRFYDKCKESICLQEVSQRDRAKILDMKIDAAIEEDILWKAELQRIQEDFLLVKNHSNDIELLHKRREEIQQMDYISANS